MFKRINKKQARRIYNEGGRFYMVACLLRPDFGVLIDSTQLPDESFDKLVNSFEYYNCTKETGRYPAYYIEVA